MALPSLLQGILIYLTQPWPTGKGVHHEGEERGGEDDYSPEEADPIIPITAPTPAIASPLLGECSPASVRRCFSGGN